jgi:hypothetical protein
MEVYKNRCINKKENEIIKITYEYKIILESKSINDKGAV